MGKKTKQTIASEFPPEYESGRGDIKHNALHALVTSPLFKTRVVKAKKGKGSFQRKAKHRGKEPFAKAASVILFL